MKGRLFAALSAGLVALMAVPVGAAVIAGSDHGGRALTATLDGGSEVPGPGDADGTGDAVITLNQGTGEVCWELSWDDIAEPTAAHIHDGAAGVAGPPVVPLSVDPPSGCAEADAELIKEIRQNPSDFYVNIHNADFPGGAIRGQLTK